MAAITLMDSVLLTNSSNDEVTINGSLLNSFLSRGGDRSLTTFSSEHQLLLLMLVDKCGKKIIEKITFSLSDLALKFFESFLYFVAFIVIMSNVLTEIRRLLTSPKERNPNKRQSMVETGNVPTYTQTSAASYRNISCFEDMRENVKYMYMPPPITASAYHPQLTKEQPKYSQNGVSPKSLEIPEVKASLKENVSPLILRNTKKTAGRLTKPGGAVPPLSTIPELRNKFNLRSTSIISTTLPEAETNGKLTKDEVQMNLRPECEVSSGLHEIHDNTDKAYCEDMQVIRPFTPPVPKPRTSLQKSSPPASGQKVKRPVPSPRSLTSVQRS